MPTIEFEGKNTEEAVEKACNQLHIPPDELKFEIVSTGSSGIFGLGSKKARIRVHVQERITARPAEPSPREEEQPARASERERKPRREPRPKGRRSDGGRPEPKRVAPRPAKPEPVVEDMEDLEYEGDLVLDASNVPLPATMPGTDESVYDGPEDETMTRAREALEGILSRMDIPGRVTVRRISNRVILNVEGENSGLLIGKKGATLDAFQFVVNKIVNRDRDDKERIIVDTEQYRERRHQALIELAARMATKARKSRRPVTISALSAHDRRVVHLALHNETGLKTRSRGDGPYKNVVIIPGKKGLFEGREPSGGRSEDNNPESIDQAGGAMD